MNVTQFIHLLVGPLSCFPLRDIINKTAISINEEMFVYLHFYFIL